MTTPLTAVPSLAPASSAPPDLAMVKAVADFAAAARSHWGIEHRVHGVLDVAFREDACRARAGHAARNLAVVRHLARNLLRQDTTRKGSIPSKRFTAALDDSYLTRILAGMSPQQPPARN